MALWDIINPSDTYTMKADDFLTAAIAVVLLGGGAYGLEEVDGERHVPVFLFGGHDEWFTREFSKTVEQALDAMDKVAVADALDSVLIGDVGDRKAFEAALAAIPDADGRARFIASYKDGKRSSMNNIGKRAEALAAALREKASKEGV